MQDAASEQPQCCVCLSTPTHGEASSSEPTDISEVGSYPFQFSLESKLPLVDSEACLNRLINEPVTLSVLVDSAVVATASLDLLPAATEGAATIARRLDLAPAPGSPVELLAKCNATVTVSFFKDDPSAAPQEGDGAVPVARVPHVFVPPNRVEGTTVLTVRPVSIDGVPDTFPAAATAAGGFAAGCGLVWATSAGATSAGVQAAPADWAGSSFAWPSEGGRRTFVGTAGFSGLQAAVQGERSLFLEFARCAPLTFRVLKLLSAAVKGERGLFLEFARCAPALSYNKRI